MIYCAVLVNIHRFKCKKMNLILTVDRNCKRPQFGYGKYEATASIAARS